jgi:hypothetical protein
MVLLISGCGMLGIFKDYPFTVEISVVNPAPIDRPDQSVQIQVKMIQDVFPDFNPNAMVVFADGKELASQAVDTDADGLPNRIVVNADFLDSENKSMIIRYAQKGEKKRDYVRRAQAELSSKFGGRFVNRIYEGGTFRNVEYLRVPPEHTDHSLDIRYEGPGWESDKIGYRFYLDWRNATDIFGKKIPDMVLQNVGLDGFESYHEMSAWGMDILKVGESLGIGSPGVWLQDHAERIAVTDSVISRIVANGPVYAKIQTRYFGWKAGSATCDVISDLSIAAGSRMTRHDLQITGNLPNLCTGIVKLEKGALLKAEPVDSGWTYLATYGPQSLADDNLGMAILYRNEDMIQLTEDKQSHVVVLNPGAGSLTYYYLAAWEQEKGGITSQEGFVQYLVETVQKLNAEIEVQISMANGM